MHPILNGTFKCVSCGAHWPEGKFTPGLCMFKGCPNCKSEDGFELQGELTRIGVVLTQNLVRTTRQGKSAATKAGEDHAKKKRDLRSIVRGLILDKAGIFKLP